MYKVHSDLVRMGESRATLPESLIGGIDAMLVVKW